VICPSVEEAEKKTRTGHVPDYSAAEIEDLSRQVPVLVKVKAQVLDPCQGAGRIALELPGALPHEPDKRVEALGRF
jgi:hypothetical protein